ncbi:efflux transporter outer membrane subunit [Roseomonas elaeocarpi]|uniref:Efflux transporter outer membrane subunit n=1 Tax=Roseomonas elaeocarpi TaxID=907779 RepID=A0ABV6JYJ3_9PROT
MISRTSIAATGRRPASHPAGCARPVLAVSLLLALAACGPKPPPVSSGLETPAQFREAANTAARWPDPQWWTGFGSPELNALMNAAAAGNFDLNAAQARVRQADAQLRITGASLLPTLDFSADASQQHNSGYGRTRGSNNAIKSLALQASYEIDFWGKNRNATEAARQSAIANRYDVGVVTLTTEASLANTYFQVLEAQEELRTQLDNLDAAQRTLAIVRAQYAAGTATGLDVAQQETLVAQQEAAVPPLRQTIGQNINSIATLVGQTPESFKVEGGRLDQLRIPEASPGLPAELLARRPDVLLAEANLASANADIAVARASLLPSVTLTGSAGFQTLSLANLITPQALVYTVAAGLTQSVFAGGALRGQVALSEAQAEELLVEYRRAIVEALVDVENAIIAYRETTEQERRRQTAVERAEQAYNISTAQLRAGTIDLITLINTQQTLFTARTSLVQARLQRFQAAVGLFRSLGGGWN